LAQPARIVDHADDQPGSERKLEELLVRPEAELDVLVGLQQNEYDLRVFGMPPHEDDGDQTACLFYPEVGLVGFPVMEDPLKKPLASVTAGAGLPLHPQVMLTMIPKTAHEPWLATVRNTLQAFSVGAAETTRKVVVPATVADRYDHAELRMRIKSLRGLAKELVRATVRMKELITQAHRMAGLIA